MTPGGERTRVDLLPRGSSGVLMAVLCLTTLPAFGAEQPPAAELRKAPLVVVTSSSILNAVNRADAIAAAKIWMGLIGQRRGFDLDIRVHVSESIDDVKGRVQDGSSNLVVLDSIEYLNLAALGILDPVATAVRGKNVRSSYCLVVNRDSGLNSVEDLGGKRISVFAVSNAHIAKIWLEVLLNERNLGRVDGFFASFSEVYKPSAACLPVFFGKLDACVIDENTLAMMSEMNPQMGTKLRVIRKSPPITEGVLSINARSKSPYREQLVQGMLEAERDTQGRQILTILKADRFLEFQGQLLDGVRELWTKYQRFAGPAAKPAVATTPSGAAGGQARVTARELNP